MLLIKEKNNTVHHFDTYNYKDWKTYTSIFGFKEQKQEKDQEKDQDQEKEQDQEIKIINSKIDIIHYYLNIILRELSIDYSEYINFKNHCFNKIIKQIDITNIKIDYIHKYYKLLSILIYKYMNETYFNEYINTYINTDKIAAHNIRDYNNYKQEQKKY